MVKVQNIKCVKDVNYSQNYVTVPERGIITLQKYQNRTLRLSGGQKAIYIII